MIRKVVSISVACVIAATHSSGQPASDTLDNTTILKLIEAGVPEEAIIAKIRSARTNFDLTTDRLIELKAKGVSGPILAAMLSPPAAAQELSATATDPAVLHYPGIYLADSPSSWTRMTPTASDQSKTGGIIGYALTGGLASMSVKAKIPGPHAKVRTGSGTPVFYIFFDESNPRALQGTSVWTGSVGTLTTSPSELSLVRFVPKSNGREARVGSVNIAGAKAGVMDRDRIAFASETVRPGVYKISLSAPLPPGEYGFVQSVTGGNVAGGGGALTARVFDFGIDQY